MAARSGLDGPPHSRCAAAPCVPLPLSNDMTPPTIFDVCQPRDDVRAGAITEADFAADLAQVLNGTAPAQYRDAAVFFQNTYPTRGLRSLLANVCRRLSGAGGEVASIFRLDTQYGGGKTHGLIALVHAAAGMQGVANVAEFIDPALVPKRAVRVAAFDGENADPASGHTLDAERRAYTPWGEIAFGLAGAAGYDRVRASDEQRVAPGADTLRELFGSEPKLILLDELSVYLRKVKGSSGARDQLSAFLSSLFKAVESTPNVALVYTLSIGKDNRATDAYAAETEFIAAQMAEAESISARKATLLNPTEDDETAQVLRRRLFASIDESRIPAVVDAYRGLWKQHEPILSAEAGRAETVDAFRASYPLHPELLATLTEKVATLSNFQRVRGMLRLLARTVGRLWEQRPGDAYAVHTHHIDLAYEPIRQELVTRLSLSQYVPVLKRDVAGDGSSPALAQQIDQDHYRGLPPYATYAARTIFVHTLAFNDQLRGLSPDELRFAMIGPGIDVSFVDDARKRFVAESAFLDDRPGAPLRFLAEANLTQIIRRQEAQVDAEEVRAALRHKIEDVFKRTGNSVFNPIVFPGGAYEVPDEVGDRRPLLVVLGYDAVSIPATVEAVPHLVRLIFEQKGADDRAKRINRNALVLVAADEARKEDMRHLMLRRLALEQLKRPDRLAELAEHQQVTVRGEEAKAEAKVAIAIQQCYRHVFYPSRAERLASDTDLGHTAVDAPAASATPGVGQRCVAAALRDMRKLRTAEDEPDSPAYIRDRTPLKKGEITTRALREEFRRDPNLAMLVGDDVFVRGIRNGIERGEFVYRTGDLLYGPGDPQASIAVDDQSFVFTMHFARQHGIWPRTVPVQEAGAEGPAPDGQPAPGAQGTGVTANPVPPALEDALSAEGVLKEALTQLWEKVRSRRIERVQTVGIRLFNASDAFKLLGVIGTVPGATKTLRLEGEYEIGEGSRFTFTFSGAATDAQPLREFLEPQLRAATDNAVTADFELRVDNGLSMAGDAAQRLTDRLGRYVAGSAQVTASGGEAVGPDRVAS